jgi:hypothetical protein
MACWRVAQSEKGVMLWTQIDPSSVPADEKTYFRFTRWRQTRALTQLLANLGASFTLDERIFSPRAPEKVKEPLPFVWLETGVPSRFSV